MPRLVLNVGVGFTLWFMGEFCIAMCTWFGALDIWCGGDWGFKTNSIWYPFGVCLVITTRCWSGIFVLEMSHSPRVTQTSIFYPNWAFGTENCMIGKQKDMWLRRSASSSPQPLMFAKANFLRGKWPSHHPMLKINLCDPRGSSESVAISKPLHRIIA